MMLKEFIGRNRAFTLLVFFILAFSSALATFPLTRDFHYEFSALIAIITTFSSGILYINDVAGKGRKSGGMIAFFKKSGQLCIAPLIIVSAVSIVQFEPLYLFGLPLYAVFVIPGVIIGAGIAELSLMLKSGAAKTMFTVLFILIVLLSVAEIYLHPNVFFYNPIIPFFPGTIYEEAIRLTPELILYRFINILFFGSLPVLRYYKKEYAARNGRIIFIIYTAAGLLFFEFSWLLNFTTTSYSLRDRFTGKAETGNCIIYYDTAQFNSRDVKYLTKLHEAYYRRLSEYFKEKPQRIETFIFSDSRLKYKYTGAGKADLSKPHLGQIYITADSYETTLEHEMAHIFTAPFGWGPFRLPDGFNSFFLEGAATSVSLSYDDYGRDYLAFLAERKFNDSDFTNELDGLKFFTANSGKSYVLSGAFCAYLIREKGIDNFKRIYAGERFEKVYKASPQRLSSEFNRYLEGRNYKYSQSLADYYFSGKSIFGRRFPHYTACVLEDIFELLQEKKTGQALKRMDVLYGITASPQLLLLKISVLQQSGRFREALALTQKKTGAEEKSGIYYQLMMKRGDIFYLSGNREEAYKVYNRILEQDPPGVYRENLLLRRELMNLPDVLTGYLTAGTDLRIKLLAPLADSLTGEGTNGIFLRLLRQKDKGNSCYSRAIHKLLNAIPAPDYSAPYIDAACIAIYNGDIALAEKICEAAAKSVREGQKEVFREFTNGFLLPAGK